MSEQDLINSPVDGIDELDDPGYRAAVERDPENAHSAHSVLNAVLAVMEEMLGRPLAGDDMQYMAAALLDQPMPRYGPVR